MSALPEHRPGEAPRGPGLQPRPAPLEQRRTSRWLFVGEGPMGAAALSALLTAQRPVAIVTSEVPWAEQPVAAVAESHGLDVVRTARLGPRPQARWPEVFRGLDVAVSACWGEILGPEALGAPTHGWLNLHPSSLPAWRGADPVAWQLLSGPTTIGCCVHRMTDGLDDGPVVAESRVSVRPEDDRGVVLERAGAELGRLAAGLIGRLSRGRPLEERAQDDAAATWCPPAGVVPAIDPRVLRAHSAARAARAFSPTPGVVVVGLDPDERFALSGVGEALTAAQAPGEVVRESADRVAIACRDRWVRGVVRRPGTASPTVVALDDPPLPDA